METIINNRPVTFPLSGRGGRAAFSFEKLTSTVLMAALCLFFQASGSAAAGKGEVVLKSTAEKEVVIKDKKGQKQVKRVDLTKVNAIPGDEVIITLSYENKGKENSDDVVITNPVPERMAYKGFSAEGKGSKITFSVDGGKNYDHPDRLTVFDKEGNILPAQPKDYTHIRWELGKSVKPGGKGTVGFRAFVK